MGGARLEDRRADASLRVYTTRAYEGKRTLTRRGLRATLEQAAQVASFRNLSGRNELLVIGITRRYCHTPILTVTISRIQSQYSGHIVPTTPDDNHRH